MNIQKTQLLLVILLNDSLTLPAKIMQNNYE
jgi:hypothetical protein